MDHGGQDIFLFAALGVHLGFPAAEGTEAEWLGNVMAVVRQVREDAFSNDTSELETRFGVRKDLKKKWSELFGAVSASNTYTQARKIPILTLRKSNSKSKKDDGGAISNKSKNEVAMTKPAAKSSAENYLARPKVLLKRARNNEEKDVPAERAPLSDTADRMNEPFIQDATLGTKKSLPEATVTGEILCDPPQAEKDNETSYLEHGKKKQIEEDVQCDGERAEKRRKQASAAQKRARDADLRGIGDMRLAKKMRQRAEERERREQNEQAAALRARANRWLSRRLRQPKPRLSAMSGASSAASSTGVTETPLPPQRNVQASTSVPAPVALEVALKPRPFKRIGNQCFINATLQALFAPQRVKDILTEIFERRRLQNNYQNLLIPQASAERGFNRPVPGGALDEDLLAITYNVATRTPDHKNMIPNLLWSKYYRGMQESCTEAGLSLWETSSARTFKRNHRTRPEPGW